MDNMDRYGDDIGHYDNIKNHLECQKKCKEATECYIWTYIEGSCFLKNEDTFKGHGDNVMSGMKNCNHSGRLIRKRQCT